MNSLRVLIAEDEIAIANLIRSLIDFDRLHLEFAGFALNGESAYEMILEKKPDIVVTDISMPVLSGLDLIKKVQDEKLPVHFIIISGLTYFNYALSALKMGVEDYLLKPINKEELNDVLEKTILKIASARKIDYQIQKLGLDSHLQALKLRRTFLTDILYNKEYPSNAEETSINNEYGYSFLAGTSFLMGITLVDGISSLNLPTQNVIIEQLMRSFQTELKKHCIDMEVYNKNNQFVFLLNYHPNQEGQVLGAIAFMLDDMTTYLENYGQLKLTVSCGVPAVKIQGLPYSMETAQKALIARILLGSHQILYAKNLLKQNTSPENIPSISELSALRSCIEIHDRKKLESLLKKMFQETAARCKNCPHLLLDSFCQMFSALLSDFSQHKMISVSLPDTYLRYCDAIETYDALHPLISFTVSFLTEILPISEQADNRENRLIQTAKTYIADHYNENLRLEDVAEQIYLAPSYFGVLFKKETGESFSSYLTLVRMEKAKELLHDTRYNIAEVAAAVGYTDKRYFSRLFKEQVGVTPKEYRKIYGS